MECKVKLEEWSCASEIKQILNKIKATPCKTAKEINFAKVSNFGKVCTPKSDTSEEAEWNGEIQKLVKRGFGEKRL